MKLYALFFYKNNKDIEGWKKILEDILKKF
jgi:hypothetical protein